MPKSLLENLGNRSGVDYRAHHIAMSNSKDVKMDAFRATRKKLGIPINSSENEIWLPKDASSRLPGDITTAHSGEGVHGDAYKNMFLII
ncbi:AHH domain-containing protein [Paraburkholderia bannensis]|uniref:AHH domain-containing protein n=1 Tax=Paraburkholderia bannensis TaxID=765414 RepID=UPI0038B7F83F